MSLVVDCAGDAHETLFEAQQDTKIHGDILQLLAVRDLVAGKFDSSYTFAMKALDARVALGTPQDLKTSNAYNYVGLALDSLERHDEAKFWFEKKESILSSSDDDLHIRLRCQHDLNTSRNLYSTGNYAEAEARLNSALQLATDFKSWYSLG
jgi:tetratricopeptide (TPR) repeat protein